MPIPVAIAPKPYWELTKAEMRMTAIQLNSAILYRCIILHEQELCTWEECLQMAACALAEHSNALLIEVTKLKKELSSCK